jgi:hypothetical protein
MDVAYIPRKLLIWLERTDWIFGGGGGAFDTSPLQQVKRDEKNWVFLLISLFAILSVPR